MAYREERIPIIRLEEQEITPKLVAKLIELDEERKMRDQRLKRYYDGDHDINYRKFQDKTKPNNKIVTNYCSYITNIYTGYFLGAPIVYKSDQEDFMEAIQDITNANDEHSINAELAKNASIYSKAYEIVYTEKQNLAALGVDNKSVDVIDTDVKFAVVDPEEQRVIVAYDLGIDPDILFAIRYFSHEDILTQKVTVHAYVYTKNSIIQYKEEETGVFVEVDSEDHHFGEVPINPYYNKSVGGQGDFEGVMTLNDAYNLLQSDDINESNYSNDAYLVLRGLVADDDDVAKMKERRVIELTGKDSDASWLIKEINDTWKENLKSRLRDDIHKTSGAPDMSDENFSGNASGVAIEYKLTPFENNRSAKERMFKKSLQRRFRLITTILNKKGKNYDPTDLEIVFTKNLPQDDSDIIDQVIKLYGTKLVSMNTLRSYIPMVEDPSLEEEKVEKEIEDSVYPDPIPEVEDIEDIEEEEEVEEEEDE